jgi:hypothetical protein
MKKRCPRETDLRFEFDSCATSNVSIKSKVKFGGNLPSLDQLSERNGDILGCSGAIHRR